MKPGFHSDLAHIVHLHWILQLVQGRDLSIGLLQDCDKIFLVHSLASYKIMVHLN